MDTAPLLTAINGLPGPNTLQDYPAFLRASHSPWRFIPQNVLVILRGLMLAFIIGTGAMIADYKLNEESDYSNWRLIFDYSIICFFLVFLYHLVTFSWTFTHLYYPHQDDYLDGIEGWIITAMSLPRNMASLRKQFYFTMFYTAVVVASFVNSVIYWFITRQNDGEPPEPQPTPAPNAELLWTDTTMVVPDAPFSDLFGEGWFRAFVILALYGLGSAIMVTEIFWLNSIKRPITIVSHILGLIFLAGLYLGWAAIGTLITDYYPFFWLDASQVGSQEAVTVYCIGFILLAPIMYVLMQGIIGIREGLTWSLSEARAIAAVHDALDS
ncbi:hypothetical protein AK830_g4388 [Neonectria ditissima]|uniref:Uncharacterized protein n=1 Tax=Neonectria ditissima TaxID=78410 RepID=A0A0P7BNI1_9HYPO|nr:hypothetical protein AK830_g4388 [Neonectria ditissima]